ncbi:MAG TPA: DNA-directed RNA polymerase subunit beta, partial [Gammaproteobacteria bacterium]|nr:DNA-directed RNA polymerase subunit beta [Gammaproteobacteria bacterium]
MAYSFTEKKRIRNNFGSRESILTEPDLLAIQIDSFNGFIQAGEKTKKDVGLHAVFQSVFPITAVNGYAEIEYVDYELQEPKFNVKECKLRGVTFASTLRVKLNLVLFDKNGSTLKKKRRVKQIIEEDVYLGQLPLMTDTGTFVINGTERVVVSQLHRSPGVIFEHDKGKTHSSGKILFSSRVIPYRGSWLDFEFDHHEHLYARIDRRRKLPVTTLLRAMGLGADAILDTFFEKINVKLKAKSCDVGLLPAKLRGVIAEFDIKSGKDIIVEKGRRITAKHTKMLEEAGVKSINAPLEYLLDKVISQDLIDKETGEILFAANTVISEEVLEALSANKVKKIEILYINESKGGAYISDTLRLDDTQTELEARMSIYHVMRPGEPATADAVNLLFNNLFFKNDRYDLSKVGRMKLNRRLGIKSETGEHVLTNDDIISVLKLLIDIKNGNDSVDDVDTLANRRVRAIGEMIENQFRIGLVRVEKAVKEGLNLAETDELTPQDLINSKPVSAAVREFFGSSQLSQFMDQVNPLSGVTHKRRISALGPGGLTRERAGFEVRDVHPSHYGRLCPIETPEGPNIGLINTLAVYAKTNDYGFLETPYQLVKKGKVTDEVIYVSAIDELEHTIAQANAAVDSKGQLMDDLIPCRRKNEFVLVGSEDVTLIDIDSKQISSVAASLIPFLEHDDANRALMGSNMQRQAVPLLKTELPLIGTGMEAVVARDSGSCLIAEADGLVRYVDAERIVVSYEGDIYPESLGTVSYDLQKYHKSNQNSCFTQKPRVKVGQKVARGDILADGPAILNGELALGKNLLVAFMPWCGFNYEDSILISERMVKEDVYTSVHIEEFEVVARDTKLGPEEITRDIPNVSEDMLKNLDESGIIRIGAKVKPDDILVGKITPKGETQLTPEERLLRAIFGDKARDVKNTSLKVPPGIEGTVINVKVFNRRSGAKDERTKQIEDFELQKLDRKEAQHVKALTAQLRDRLWKVVSGKRLATSILGRKKGEVLAEANKPLKREYLDKIPVKKLNNVFVNKEVNEDISELLANYENQLRFIKNIYDQKRDKVTEGDDLPPGVIKMVKVYIAVKRKLNVGDKMAGRHGNKGVVSCILPEEDMPFFADGTPVDIVLNPLGVPSRMNIGQIMETHLGWAARELGKQIASMLESGVDIQMLRKEVKEIFDTREIDELVDSLDDEEFVQAVRELKNGIIVKTPVFDGAKEEEIWRWLKRAGLRDDGKAILYDG